MPSPAPPSSASSASSAGEPTASASVAFAGAARAIRRRLHGRALWRGALWGMPVLCGAALVRWLVGASFPPGVLWLAPGVGAAVSSWRARRTRWSDAEIASYLDARWNLPETLLSWTHAPADPQLELQAAAALHESRPLPRPRAWSPQLLATTALAGLCVLALPWLPVRTPASQALATERALPAPSLSALGALRELPARDDLEREQRLALVAEAERLEAQLREGVSRAEAQAQLGALRERLAEEHRSLGSTSASSGIDAAARMLEGRGAKSLAEALANRDLVAFDEELERLAADREKTDRASARRALEEAAAAARAAQAVGVAKLLDESAEKLAERAARNDALRELADAIREAGGDSEELASAAERLANQGGAEAAQAAADAMAKALSQLSAEEKARLAKNLAALRKGTGERGAPGAGDAPLDPAALESQIRELAKNELSLREAERDRGFRDAERNLDQAGNELRGVAPGPAGAGAGSRAAAGAGAAGKGANGAGAEGGGPSQGGGPGTHASPTAPVAAGELRARARGHDAAGGTHVTVTGPGTVGESPLRDPGSVSAAARARELGNLDDGQLPAEYRDQVRRYFTP